MRFVLRNGDWMYVKNRGLGVVIGFGVGFRVGFRLICKGCGMVGFK